MKSSWKADDINFLVVWDVSPEGFQSCMDNALQELRDNAGKIVDVKFSTASKQEGLINYSALIIYIE